MKSAKKGFTLIELMIVISIIGRKFLDFSTSNLVQLKGKWKLVDGFGNPNIYVSVDKDGDGFIKQGFPTVTDGIPADELRDIVPNPERGLRARAIVFTLKKDGRSAKAEYGAEDIFKTGVYPHRNVGGYRHYRHIVHRHFHAKYERLGPADVFRQQDNDGGLPRSQNKRHKTADSVARNNIPRRRPFPQIAPSGRDL